ncbi:MAG: hypothetical protein H7A35_03570 [Planctomycetales bacterium]|nr:hypothetical protein [bacterium]UNM09134.1 MAG: hypothetical protein H7A35_03570 [Planctomycetales bacterium]
MALLDPQRQKRWWLLLLATAVMLWCGVMFLFEFRRGTAGLDLMEFTAMKLALPMGIALVMLFFYLNKPGGQTKV